MPQLWWKYIDTEDTVYEIGLYHGNESGHVVIYCNQQIIKIDFSILYQKNYSFMIGEELLEILLDKEKDLYSLRKTTTNKIIKIFHKTDK